MYASCGGRRYARGKVHHRFARAIDLAVPPLVAAIIIAGGLLQGGSGVRPLTLALGVGAALSLYARYRAPLATLIASAMLVVALINIDHVAGAVAVIAPAVALYAVALTRGRSYQLFAAGTAIAAVIAADLLLARGHLSPTQTAGHLALIAVPLLAAEALRTHRDYITLLLERVEIAEHTREQEAQQRATAERVRIARELHDVVAHTLTTINVQAAVAGHLSEPTPARDALAMIEEASREALRELRGILGVLRDGEESAPLAPAPGIATVADLIERAREHGIDVRLDSRGTPPPRLPESVGLAAFRIVQESLTNAARHAPQAPVRVNLHFDERELEVAIENEAPLVQAPASAPGVGVAGMRERAQTIGGTLVAGPIGGGFRVAATLPYQP